MELNDNPFRYGADFGSEEIVGRNAEIRQAEYAIRDGLRLFLIGPRGFGKTSILRAAQANMAPKGAVVLCVNAETSQNVGKLVGEIVTGAAWAAYFNLCRPRHKSPRNRWARPQCVVFNQLASWLYILPVSVMKMGSVRDNYGFTLQNLPTLDWVPSISV